MANERIAWLNENLDQIRDEKIILSKLKTFSNNLFSTIAFTERNIQRLYSQVEKIVSHHSISIVLEPEQLEDMNFYLNPSITLNILPNHNYINVELEACPQFICTSCIDDILFDRGEKMNQCFQWELRFKGKSKCPHCKRFLLKIF